MAPTGSRTLTKRDTESVRSRFAEHRERQGAGNGVG